MSDRLQIVFGGLAPSLTLAQAAVVEPRLAEMSPDQILALRDDCRARLQAAMAAANHEVLGTNDPNALIPVDRADEYCRAFARHVGDMLIGFVTEVTQ